MTDFDRLIEKLQRIEALFAGGATPGERAAAFEAMQRMRQRLRETEREDPAVEYRFTLSDEWSRKLFNALLRRYKLHPYRYYRQRYTTVMVKVPTRFVDDVLWPEFTQLNDALREHLNEVCDRIIRQAVNEDTSDAQVVAELGTGG